MSKTANTFFIIVCKLFCKLILNNSSIKKNLFYFKNIKINKIIIKYVFYFNKCEAIK